ncbi:hypothetical protein [Chryseobacterium pennipullorum]|uniref:Lipoprotein n=1 Tax=Chryseobacterium pennipullorum TaxID=2258963 RepID=A0A3D9B878_9FLAO|nr:hypothetical protein [Chryseobacterium pennipullorum]REC49406.1 hypothetical protein DRF67_02690 [Chryseobacterium pennipullorum]
MFHKAVLLSLGIFALTGCDAQKKAKSDTKTSEMSSTNTKASDQNGHIIYFSEGENRFLKDYKLNVTFKGVSEDSRCPEGVNCIWAGVAVAQVEVMGTYSRPVVLDLASMNHEARNYHQSAEVNGYTITLENIAPHPKADSGAKALAGKYKIGISIKKKDSRSEESTRK